MKKLFLFVLSIAVFSCGVDSESESSASSNILGKLSFTSDTLVINPGQEIINLSQGVRNGSLDESKTYFYLFDEVTAQMNKINLDELILEEQIPFEKEGPNGVGANYVTTSRYLPGEEFLFANFQNTGIFNRNGEKVQDLTLKPGDIQVEGLSENAQYNLTNQIEFSPDRKWMYSLPGDFIEGTNQLAKINLESKSGNIIPIPALDKVGEYRILLQMDDSFSIYVEELFLQQIAGKYFLSGGSVNSIYRFVAGQDSLQLFEFDFSLVANEKEIPINNKVSSQEEFQAEMDKARSQIGFDKLLFDEKTKRFYRFGRIYKPRVDIEAPLKAQVFLFAFDENLNLIGETEIPDWDKVPSNAFFKEGKLWSYVNVDDELGFAVFTLNFN